MPFSSIPACGGRYEGSGGMSMGGLNSTSKCRSFCLDILYSDMSWASRSETKCDRDGEVTAESRIQRSFQWLSRASDLSSSLCGYARLGRSSVLPRFCTADSHASVRKRSRWFSPGVTLHRRQSGRLAASLLRIPVRVCGELQRTRASSRARQLRVAPSAMPHIWSIVATMPEDGTSDCLAMTGMPDQRAYIVEESEASPSVTQRTEISSRSAYTRERLSGRGIQRMRSLETPEMLSIWTKFFLVNSWGGSSSTSRAKGVLRSTLIMEVNTSGEMSVGVESKPMV